MLMIDNLIAAIGEIAGIASPAFQQAVALPVECAAQPIFANFVCHVPMPNLMPWGRPEDILEVSGISAYETDRVS